jgi:hypothetical protein
MGAINDAITAIKSLDPGESFLYKNITATYGVN